MGEVGLGFGDGCCTWGEGESGREVGVLIVDKGCREGLHIGM